MGFIYFIFSYYFVLCPLQKWKGERKRERERQRKDRQENCCELKNPSEIVNQ